MSDESRVIRKLAGVYQVAGQRGAVIVTDGRPAPPAWTLDADQLLDVQLRRGRDRAGADFEPGLLTFSVPAVGAGAVDRFTVGDLVKLRVSDALWAFLNGTAAIGGLPDAAVYANDFRGTVSDARLAYHRQGAGRPPQPVVQVTVVGPLARAAQAMIGDEPWTNGEPVTDRAVRIYNAGNAAAFAGWGGSVMYPWIPLPSYYDNVIMPARDVDRQSPVTLLNELAGDIGGWVRESIKRHSRIMIEPLETRAGRTPLVQLTPAEIADTATWQQTLQGLVNRYTVEYGGQDPFGDGTRHEVTVVDEDSVARFGDYAASRSTKYLGYWPWPAPLSYDDPQPAQRLARLVVGRNSRPTWSITRLDVDLLDLALPRAKAMELLRADVGDLVELTGMPTSAPDVRWLFVEGSELTVTKHDVRLTLYVSDANRTGAPMTWDSSPADLTWADVRAGMTWLQAAGWFEPPPTGPQRWVDVPGNLRWIDLAALVTEYDNDPAAPTWASYPDAP